MWCLYVCEREVWEQNTMFALKFATVKVILPWIPFKIHSHALNPLITSFFLFMKHYSKSFFLEVFSWATVRICMPQYLEQIQNTFLLWSFWVKSHTVPGPVRIMNEDPCGDVTRLPLVGWYSAAASTMLLVTGPKHTHERTPQNRFRKVARMMGSASLRQGSIFWGELMAMCLYCNFLQNVDMHLDFIQSSHMFTCS